MRQINIFRLIMMLLIILVASIYIPNFYWKVNKHEVNRTGVYYSPITKSFILAKSDVREVVYTNPKGEIYSRDEFEQLLPFLNFRQLMLNGKLPDSLDGVELVPKQINMNNIQMRAIPLHINSRPLQLYPLIESASGRVRLELPPDYFRIRDRMEFITSETNKINEEKSKLFTDALIKEGFHFPAKFIYGNPSTKKPFDEGYFVIDDSNYVFHIKMVKRKPFCKNTGIPSNLNVAFMAINETELREFYGMIITKSNEAYLISYDHYKLLKLPVEDYNYQKDVLSVRCDLFYRTIIINKENGIKTIIADRKYKAIDKYSEARETKEEKTAGVLASYIFPFSIETEKDTTPFINFYFNFSGIKSFILSALFVIAAFFYLQKKKVSMSHKLIYFVLILFTGMFGFIALLAVRDFEGDPEKQ